MHHISQIATALKANWLQQSADTAIEHILIDSRKLIFPTTTLFFALNGPRRSGDNFVEELYTKGVRNFVVDELFNVAYKETLATANILQVKNVLQSLQHLATFHRQQFQLPVVGITGSNGKTIVKEWLYQLLHANYSIVRSPKSYNSQIGVPLSVWQINQQHTLGIFEAGISQPDEMQQLEKMIAPTIGIFTNIGDAHSEGFLNIRQKINEKLRLFVGSHLLIYNADSPDINEAINIFVSNVPNGDGLELFTWGKKESSTLQVIGVQKKNNSSHIAAIFNPKEKQAGRNIQFVIPFTDDASIENAITCCCVLLHLQVPDNVITERMAQLKPVEMRLELKSGINQCSVINDSYSADINSLTIALDFLAQQKQHPTLTVILSDILQSGKSTQALYAEVANILQRKNINRFIGIGVELEKNKAAFSGIAQTDFFTSVAEFKQQFHRLHFHNESILLKGARLFAFEQISHLLEEKAHQTVLEINLNAITHNLKKYQQLLHPGVRIMAMVKAFSYGSGSFEIANLLQFHKVDYLAVAYTDEGVELRKAGITLPIMVMSPEVASFDMLLQHNLEPELYSFDSLLFFQQYLLQSGIENYPVHIKIDSGMHRLGFEENEIPPLIKLLYKNASFKIQSVFSHLAASGNEAFDEFTQQQATIFLQCCNSIEQAIGYSFIRHIANTSAIHRHKNLQLDMVRLGIGLYGVDSHPTMQQQLSNVTTLKTTIAQIKTLKAGDSVGYDRSGKATKDTVIATVRIGYADGFSRSLGNGVGKMWVNNQLAPVIGNVCMDMVMLDVTGIPVAVSDEVIVFGEALPVYEVAKWANTISYEILTSVSQRVRRVYFEE